MTAQTLDSALEMRALIELRAEIVAQHAILARLRARRNGLALQLRRRGRTALEIAAAAGVSDSYLSRLTDEGEMDPDA